MTDVAANTSTTAAFTGFNGFGTKGEAYSGILETADDQDWIRVELLAGQSYQFAVDAHYNQYVANTPMVSIRDASGVVQQVQQTVVSETVLTSFTAAVGGTFYLTVQASSVIPGGSEYDAFVVGPARTTQVVNGAGATVVGGEGVFLVGGTAENQFALGRYGIGFTGVANDIVSVDAAGGVAHAGGGDDYMAGGDGADIFWGGWGDDRLDGGGSADQLFGDQGRDYVRGGAGTDTLKGGDDADLLTGDDDGDVLDGGTGADRMFGGAGDDTFYVDTSADQVIEATGAAGGSDTVKASAAYALGAGEAVEKLETTSATGTGALSLFGNELAQTITGNDGANNLVGNGGNDTISARGGADGLQGGAGNDTMAGNGGNDGFYFNTALNAATNVDRILDFGQATGNADLIRLDNAIFTTLGAAGFLNPDFFKANATGLATQSDDHIVYETDTGKLFYDTNGNTAGGATQFATLTNFASLTGGNAISAADFYVY